MNERIGPYEIQRELGRGGMGIVYLARDSRLDRLVAIKALPERLAQDPDRLARFEREAKTLAQLNHPNVAGIYGIEEHEGARYLVLEFVEGQTLADRLDRGPLPLDEVIEIAVQIAAAIEAAHDAGVIHRDLKPANVIVTPEGRAKVLDFGLARVDEGGTSSSGTGEEATLTSPALQHSPTMPGVILGTAAYMSPEQARGRRIDKRTDIWSFGVVLYEMLTGASPFVGETVSDSIGAILHKDLNLGALPAGTPFDVERVLRRCLERDKSLRYRDIGDVRIELERRETPRAGSESSTRARGLPISMALASAALVAVIAGVAMWFASRALLPRPEPIVRKLEILSLGPEEDFVASSPRISPDGMKIAFIQKDAVKVRDLSTFDIVTVAQAKNASVVEWSPDGRSLVYATQDSLFRVPATGGGGASRLGDYTPSFPIAWTADDRLLFSSEIDGKEDADGILEMPARGGAATMLLKANKDEVVDFHAVAAIPGTDVLLLVRHRVDQKTPIEAWNGSEFVVIADFDDQYLSAPVWSPSGHVLFARGFGKLDLWAVPFSPQRMKVTGDPFLVQTDASAPTVSAAGTLSFVRGSTGSSGELAWVLPDGSTELIGDGGELVSRPLVSPDGTRVAFAGGPRLTDLEVWVRDLARGINTRISSLDGFVMPVAWSPDGREIAVANFDPAAGEKGENTRFLAADGSGPTREPFAGLLLAFNADWTRAVQVSDPRRGKGEATAFDVETMSRIGEAVSGVTGMGNVALSPDGQLLLYESRDSGETQVYCTRFPSGEGRWQVSGSGGYKSQWSPDGSSVYYVNTDSDLIRVPLTREPAIRFGLPEKVFPVSLKSAESNEISPAPDGKRFITVRGRSEEDSNAGYKLLLIENWYEEFRKDHRR